LSGFELATRLSYYLETMQNQPLLLDAQSEKLATDAGLSTEVDAC